jgi:hypothetical protein
MVRSWDLDETPSEEAILIVRLFSAYDAYEQQAPNAERALAELKEALCEAMAHQQACYVLAVIWEIGRVKAKSAMGS